MIATPATALRPVSFSSPGRPTALPGLNLALIAACLAVAGCAATPPQPPAAPAAAPPRSAVAAEAGASAVAPAASEPDVQATPVARQPAVQGQPLPLNPEPGSYAHREDARALAEALAQRHGLDAAWATSVLQQAQVSESVKRLIMPAPAPTAKNWAAYRSRFVEPQRIRAGVAFWREHEPLLRRAEATFGVPMDIVAGVLGVETIYGRYTGNVRVLDALTTLSLDFPSGRSDRSAYFQEELGHFLRLCRDQGDDPGAVLGSFAGAIGLPQFMPGSVRRFAVDFDGDGRIDLRNSPADAIGSVAHYLSQHGWQRGMPTHYAVTPPPEGDARARLLGPDIVPSFTAAEMQQAGAQLDAPGGQHTGLLALVLLHNGGAQPTYIAGTDNFYAITRYNQSSYYALAVIELGRAVAQAAQATQAGQVAR